MKNLFCLSLSLVTFNLSHSKSFNNHSDGSGSERSGSPVSVSQSDLECNPRASTVKIDYTMPDGQKKQGSGVIVEKDGQYAILTASHVISGVPAAEGNREKQHNSNVGAGSATVRTASGKSISVDLSGAKTSKSYGNEAALIPLNGDIGVPAMGVAKKSSSKGEYTHVGHSASSGYKETKSQKATGIGQRNGFQGETRKGYVESGMSGGAVVDENCQVVGVNSEATNVGIKGEPGINLSKVGGVF